MVSRSGKKGELPPDESEPKASLGGDAKTNPAGKGYPSVSDMYQSKGRNQRSLDAEYALSHGMWVCERCETLNEGSLGTCKVCGAEK